MPRHCRDRIRAAGSEPWASRALYLALFALNLAWLAPSPASAQTRVDLELVLAVDISMSMDIEEQRLQRQGYVDAFRDANLHHAISSGQFKRIAVTYFEWAGENVTRTIMPWTVIDGPAAANRFADMLAEQPIARARYTSISAALRYAGEMLAASPYRGIRRVVDISGDGPNNNGPVVTTARDALLDKGIVINGLPIVLKRNLASGFDMDGLDIYYRDCVTGGDGSFVIPITREAEFLTATRQKLIREIAAAPADPVAPRLIRTGTTETAAPGDDRSTTDCLIGEKMWDRYWNRQRFEN